MIVITIIYTTNKGVPLIAQGVPKRISKVYTPAGHKRDKNTNRLADAQTNKRARPPHMEIIMNINISCLHLPIGK
jgi:hypothetical protein